jgi:hypothetical protein
MLGVLILQSSYGRYPSEDEHGVHDSTFPQNGQDIAVNQPFNVTLQVANLQAGSFTNATTTYYAAPQAVNSQGNIIGHVHVTIQDIGGTLNPTTPPDPTTFAFFKGIDDAGNGQGCLSAAVASGLPAGFYRVCTMSSASNHQPVLMPVSLSGIFNLQLTHHY